MPVDVPPSGLPVEECVPALRQALTEAGSAVLVAPPGAGKTTIVPLRLLEEPWLAGMRIVMLEPRRLATRAAARRMASLLGEDVGATVGYTTRDERKVGRATRIEVVTEGILTRRLQTDPSLPGVGLVVFDELHERNLQADLALALVLDARPALRPDLRVLAMSATLEAARVAALLGDAPVIESEGRAHEVTVRWSPRRPKDRLDAATTAGVRRAVKEEPGDVLVFLPGAADIRRVEASLRGGGLPPDVDVRPLFGALTAVDQDAALAPSPPGRRRVVLATDIAETSLTVEGVRIVVDSGEARSPRFDARTGLTKLRTGPISRASAEQRAGRAGRNGPGVAYRLWSRLEHGARRPYADPEISSVDLAGLALELAVWGSDPADLAFLDPPPRRALDEARSLLAMLGAVDDGGRPTSLGRAMADLPLHPRLARMVVGAVDDGLGWTACVVAALLEDRDVLRGRPDDLPTDVAERVSLIADQSARHPLADSGAVRSAARRAGELARRAGVGRVAVDPSRCGLVLALAYPDRLAQSRGGARFRLRNGSGAWLPAGDPLAGEAFLAIADIDAGRGDGRIRLAAGLDAADVEEAAGAAEEHVTVSWDGARDDLRARVERRLGSLVLTATEGPAPPGPVTTRALVGRVRSTRLAALHWTDKARALQHRAAFARRALGDRWPDLSDAALVATLDDWLAPLLAQATSRADIEAVDVTSALRARLGHQLARELDRVAPTNLTIASGRTVPVDYSDGQPVMAVRVQDLFGSATHPTVGDGKVPVVLQLLSPAGRPVQVTADLPGFWAGTWAEVRKEMAGRYPKHSWPLDPLDARPPAKRRAR
ncbi:MAG: ATP-dependent helicase HrpB [uncultured Acidimicrobiales bacterium]|uniref:RNA helicase n=1 Tax=uncultured Acidimicrobiales bacterium TaxID=310071 RepID=A0A6J4J9K3_9ACTN|nr:MAG: ATP-dependent helicase HrpB [uncultured Acidimicrobiales bacterium]